jgi:glutamyl-Q tRNA(Asp) synthetase
VTAIFRFAPSPTGYLHLGHAVSAIIGHDWARHIGGRFLVRIENTDPDRVRPEFEAGILDALAWLQLTWDGPVRRQSEHFDTYRAAAGRLHALGLLYPCQATRTELEALAGTDGPRDPDGAPRVRRAGGATEYQHDPDRPLQMRLDMARAIEMAHAIAGDAALRYTSIDRDGRTTEVAANPGDWGDVVVQRKGTPTSYHLSVVVDDALQGVTHVTRGRDLLRATDLHRILQVLLRLPPPLYHHHGLLLDDSGRKLAKTRNSKSLLDLRRDGVTPDDIRLAIARLV